MVDGGGSIELAGGARAYANSVALPIESLIDRHAPGGGPDLIALIADRVDPGSFRPRLADDLERKAFPQRWGPSYVMLANPRDLLHLRLDRESAAQIELMDGTRTVKDILVERLEAVGDIELDDLLDLV